MEAFLSGPVHEQQEIIDGLNRLERDYDSLSSEQQKQLASLYEDISF